MGPAGNKDKVIEGQLFLEKNYCKAIPEAEIILRSKHTCTLYRQFNPIVYPTRFGSRIKLLITVATVFNLLYSVKKGLVIKYQILAVDMQHSAEIISEKYIEHKNSYSLNWSQTRSKIQF